MSEKNAQLVEKHLLLSGVSDRETTRVIELIHRIHYFHTGKPNLPIPEKDPPIQGLARTRLFSEDAIVALAHRCESLESLALD